MSTEIKLYQVDFEPRDNFYIEEIDEYLKSLPSTSVRFSTDKGNYLKLSMNLELKLPVDQSKQIDNLANYATIKQDNGETYYYFIVSARWVAKKTVAVSLILDTVETFWNKLDWSERTQITREHRNRLIRLNKNTYLRNIDRYTENLNPALISEEKEEKILDDVGAKWYLVYMSNPATTQDTTSAPLFMGLLSNVSYKLADAGTGTTDKSINIQDNSIYYITDSGQGEEAYISVGGTRFELGTVSGNATKRAIGISRSGSRAQYREIYYTGDTYPYSFSEGSWKEFTGVPSSITFHNIRVCHKTSYTDYNKEITNLDKLDALESVEVNAGTYPALETTSLANFDRSNSRISKIIELPYCPVNATKSSSGIYSFSDCSFNYGYNILQFNGMNLYRTIKQDNRIQDLLYVNLENPTAKDSPNVKLESKLYNSEFYDYSYLYDTDKIKIRLEDIKTDLLTATIGINYAITTTMNSDKQFNFSFLNSSYKKNQPYELYMNSNRSTEIMVLNDSYATYIKNGYNYDQWANKRQQKLATISALVSGAQSSLNLASSGYSLGSAISSISELRRIQNIPKQASSSYRYIEHPKSRTYEFTGNIGGTDYSTKGEYSIALAEAEANAADARVKEKQATKETFGIGSLVLNSGINAITSTINSVASIESNKRQFENSINSRANSPISASGNVPTDLFDNYSSNKLTREEYTLRDEDKKNVFNMFRYMGYAHPLQELPDFSSRIYSNFVQCTPVFNNGETEVYKIFLDDIVQRFQAGITVKHRYNGIYDLHDSYENYERFVLEDN